MHINFTIEDDQKTIGEGPIQVGWFLIDDKASILFESPYRMRSQSQQNMRSRQVVAEQYFSLKVVIS